MEIQGLESTFEKEIKAEICPYCGEKPELVSSSEIYGTQAYGKIYLCRPCDAYVGVHNKTDEALGSLANKELREWRKKAHYVFDKIAKTNLINKVDSEYTFISGKNPRQRAYYWLSQEMGVKEDYCHIAMFDVEECKEVIEICEKALFKISEAPYRCKLVEK